VHPAAILVIRYRSLIRQASHGAGLYALLVGVATFWGGDQRMMGPSYITSSDVAESMGASPSVLWGVSAMLVGALALLPHRKVSLCGLYGVVAWSVVFGLSFLVSVNTEPLAGVSGVFGHGFIAVMVTGLIVVRIVDPRV
jgi:hypothetical protein